MKFVFTALLLIINLRAFAESPCDVRPGTSMGIKVVEFTTGNTILSKIPFSETTPSSLVEEMLSLQDMGLCEEKIYAQKCILKFEKHSKGNYITLIRGKDRWSTWTIKSKNMAQDFVKSMKRLGFCS